MKTYTSTRGAPQKQALTVAGNRFHPKVTSKPHLTGGWK